MKTPGSHGTSTDNGVHLRWSCKSDVAKKLASGIISGDIDPNMPPKTVWESDPEFGKCKLSSFRAFLNREKARLGGFCTPPIAAKTSCKTMRKHNRACDFIWCS